MAVKTKPEGYHSVTPYLSIDGAANAIDFYKRAFDASECFRMMAPNDKIGHAEIRIGDSAVMLADPCPGAALRDPQALQGPAVGLYVYVEDADALFARAIDAGAKTVMSVQNQFWGDRSGTLKDPFGHVWTLATHKEDLSPEEIHERAKTFSQQMGT